MWTKIDDQFYLNPKVIRAGRDARDVYLAGLVYCNNQLTDGYIPANAVPMLCAWAGVSTDESNCQAIAKLLLDVGLWEFDGITYHVHDFFAYNPSKAEVLHKREGRAAAGRKGGSVPRKQTPSNSLANDEAKPEQNSTPYPLTTTTATETFLNIRGGAINALDVQQLDDLIKEYGDEKVTQALETANRGKSHEFLSLAYVAAILQGRGQQHARNGRNGHNGTARAEPQPADYVVDVPDLPPPPPPPECEKLWQRITEHLSHQMARATFEQNLRGSHCTADAGDVLTVEVRDLMIREMLDKRLRARIEQAARAVSGRPGLNVAFEASLELAA